MNPKFKAVLRDPSFQEKVGLFAIDELHCVSEWKDFRIDYTYIFTLRALLPRRVPWFGCTATLDKQNQSYILEHAGFDLANLKIIRTSVDRPEISLIVQPLLRGALRDHRRLIFLLDTGTSITPQAICSIPKTIIYLDSKPQLIEASHVLTKHLTRKGLSKNFARKVIRRDDADVRDTDKDIIWKDFSKKDTNCRIILATVSLGMGMDVPDVERVVQFGLPPTPSLSDLWQRFGRAMRKIKGQGKAYLFAPYWAFDHLGSTEKQTRKPKAPRRQQSTVPSRLHEMVLVDRDEDEAASQASHTSHASSQAAPGTSLTVEGAELQSLHDIQARVKWSPSDEAQREKLDPTIAAFLNASCFRKFILDYLQEPDDPSLEHKRDVNPNECCNRSGCVRGLGRVPPLTPQRKGSEKPSTGSLAGVALHQLSSWCKHRAQDLIPLEQRQFDLVPEMYMDLRLQYAIARVFSKTQKDRLGFNDIQGLATRVPDLKNWEHLATDGSALISFCMDSLPNIHDIWVAEKQKRTEERASQRGLRPGSSINATGKRAVPDSPVQSPTTKR